MRYRLFGMKPTEENIAKAKGYYRATPGYLLIYTAGRKPAKSILVKEEQLSPDDRAWLRMCNLEIIQETVEKSPDIQQRMTDFLSRLGAELEVERKKVEKVGK